MSVIVASRQPGSHGQDGPANVLGPGLIHVGISRDGDAAWTIVLTAAAAQLPADASQVRLYQLSRPATLLTPDPPQQSRLWDFRLSLRFGEWAGALHHMRMIFGLHAEWLIPVLAELYPAVREARTAPRGTGPAHWVVSFQPESVPVLPESPDRRVEEQLELERHAPVCDDPVIPLRLYYEFLYALAITADEAGPYNTATADARLDYTLAWWAEYAGDNSATTAYHLAALRGLRGDLDRAALDSQIRGIQEEAEFAVAELRREA